MPQLKNRMAVKGSDKLKFSGGVGGGGGGGGGGGDGPFALRRKTSSNGKSTLHSEARNPVTYADSDSDDVPLSERLSRMSNLATPSCNRDVPIKKRRSTTTMPVKRSFDNRGLSNNSVKKLKATPFDNHGKDKHKDDAPLLRRIEMPDDESADKSFSSLKKDLEFVEQSYLECKRKRQKEEKKLKSIQRDIEESKKKRQDEEKKLESLRGDIEESKKKRQDEEKKLESLRGDIEKCSEELEKGRICVERINETHKKLEKKIEDCGMDVSAKEAQLRWLDNLIRERKLELEKKETELRRVMDNINKVSETKTLELKTKERELDAMKKQFDGQAEKLELEKEMFSKIIEINKTGEQARMKKFESTKKQFDEQVKKLQLKEKFFEGRLKEFNSTVERYQGQMKELESDKKHFDSRVKELESNKKQFEGQVKEFRSKEKLVEDEVKKFQSMKGEFEGRVKKFESEKEEFNARMQEHWSKEKLLQDQVKEFQSIEVEFEGRVKEFESKEEEFEARMQELKRFVSQMEDFKSGGKELESKDTKFKVHAKEPKSKEKQFDGDMKDLESKPNKFDGQPKLPELREKQYVALIEPFDEEPELSNTLSPTSEQNDEFESSDSDILAKLQGVSDPSKDVLEILLHPTIPNCKMGDDAVIIENTHINLLEELMRVSPDVRPQVREDARKLALVLKAKMEENNENSLVVLGFLLVLAIYGLVPSFGEDYILKLFGLVSQHNVAVELFRAMGFADKISYFVDDLIKRQQYVEAVRFSRAFHFGDNNQLVDLLRGHVQNAKLISESSCNINNFIEIKDKARDQEIASLETVILSLSNNSLESKDLLNEIDNRILELRNQKGK